MIPKIASKLQLPQRIHRQAANIIMTLDDHPFQERTQMLLQHLQSTWQVYKMRLNYSVTQHKVSYASGITEVSIRNFTKLIKSIQK